MTFLKEICSKTEKQAGRFGKEKLRVIVKKFFEKYFRDNTRCDQKIQ